MTDFNWSDFWFFGGFVNCSEQRYNENCPFVIWNHEKISHFFIGFAVIAGVLGFDD